MTADRLSQLLAIVGTIQESDPEISTEQLLARAADMGGCEDVSEVVEALAHYTLDTFAEQVINLPPGSIVQCHHMVHEYEVLEHVGPGRVQLREVGAPGRGVGCPISYITQVISKPV